VQALNPEERTPETTSYHYADAALGFHHAYLLPVVHRELASVRWPAGPRRVFDVGCGNGSVAANLAARAYEVTGIDGSREGIANARKANPDLRLFEASVYDDLAAEYGRFPAVISLEVVEHVYDPRAYARRIFDLLTPGGTAILSTPYHGYLKNLAIALTGKTDAHVNPLTDHGHIKFWSMRTLSALLAEVGFGEVRYHRVGRIPVLAKSMVAVVRR
jgi:2-polyprenyl-6-hydroxyphenyl methylase/3-demethylubiquinone-9 3-methyltransferase